MRPIVSARAFSLASALLGVCSLTLLACPASKPEVASTPTPTPEPSSAAGEPAGAAGDDDSAENDNGVEGEEDLVAVAPVAPASTNGSAALLAEANRELAAMRKSTYAHKTHVEEASGTFDYDCSGLVDYMLARIAPDALETLRTATVKRPLAKHFVQFINAIAAGGKHGRWHRVTRVQDLAPGDIVAWLKPEDVSSKNTGHIMTVRAPVTVDPKRSTEFAVPVIDSTSVRHGTSDSRYTTHATGLGTGTMYLTVDARGEARGYLWSHGKKSHEHATTVALGRVE